MRVLSRCSGLLTELGVKDLLEMYFQNKASHAPQEGVWTFGLFQCWGKRSKVVKSAVHIPCCPSFRFLPWKWRGVCFGRYRAGDTAPVLR